MGRRDLDHVELVVHPKFLDLVLAAPGDGHLGLERGIGLHTGRRRGRLRDRLQSWRQLRRRGSRSPLRGKDDEQGEDQQDAAHGGVSGGSDPILSKVEQQFVFFRQAFEAAPLVVLEDRRDDLLRLVDHL